MKTTLINDGLPEPIFLALKNDKYDPGRADYTPSSLNQPAYQIALSQQLPPEKMQEPASSRIWALLGSAVHYMIELAGEEAKGRYECERRYYGTVNTDPYGIKVIGAQADIVDIEGKALYDMKTTSVYAIKDGAKPEWVSQLNVQRWAVFKETGLIIEKLYIVAILRDWTKTKAFESGYPKAQCVMIEIPIWELQETENWILGKVIERENAKASKRLHDIEPCSDEETWAKPTTFAIKKPGGARALKVCYSMEEAVSENGQRPGTTIEIRHGERTRCKAYCPCADHCPAYQAFLKESE